MQRPSGENKESVKGILPGQSSDNQCFETNSLQESGTTITRDPLEEQTAIIPLPSPPSAPIRGLVDIDPLEAARQLTLIEEELFALVLPREYLKSAWTKQDRAKRAPNLIALFLHEIRTRNWLITEILREPDVHARAAIIGHIILIAEVHMRPPNKFRQPFVFSASPRD